MVRILSMFLYFFRELVFDSKEEYNFRSRKFNIRKVLVFVLLFAQFIANVVFINRIYAMAVTNFELTRQIQEYKVKVPREPSSDSAQQFNKK